MGMELNLVQLIAYTDWNETQQKQPDGSWLITTTTGCLSRCHETVRNMQMVLVRITIC